MTKSPYRRINGIGLLAGTRSVIDRYGGTLTLYTTTDLNLARKM